MAAKKSRIEPAPKPTTAAKPVGGSKPPGSPAVAPKAAAAMAVKAGTPRSPVKKSLPKVAAKPAEPIKLTDKQAEFLKTIRSASHPGFKSGKKGDFKALEALLNKRLVKKGAKEKTSGDYYYSLSKAGERHLDSKPT